PMQRVHERGVDEALLLPQNRRPGVFEDFEGTQRIGREQRAPRERRRGEPEALHDAVVETVDRAAAALDEAFERREQTVVEPLRERLDLDEYLQRGADHRERALAPSDGPPVAEPPRP